MGQNVNPAKFLAAARELPEVKSRSCLEPFDDTLFTLRQKGLSLREIAHWLSSNGGPSVSAQMIHKFLTKRRNVASPIDNPVEAATDPKIFATSPPQISSQVPNAKKSNSQNEHHTETPKLTIWDPEEAARYRKLRGLD